MTDTLLKFPDTCKDDGVEEILSSTPNIQQITNLHFFKTPITDAGLAPIAKLLGGNITRIYFDRCDLITDAGMEFLAQFPYLTSLEFHMCKKLTNNCLPFIAKLGKLKLLHLSAIEELSSRAIEGFCDASESGESLTELSIKKNIKLREEAVLKICDKFPNLTVLDLFGCNRLEYGIWKGIGKLTKLTDLDLQGCDELSATGQRHLLNCTNLTRLSLVGCAAQSDDSLAIIGQLPNLVKLNLWHCSNITDDGIKSLVNAGAGVPKLEELNLAACNGLTNACLDEIPKLAKLKSLVLPQGGKITKEAHSDLQDKMHNCEVFPKLMKGL